MKKIVLLSSLVMLAGSLSFAEIPNMNIGVQIHAEKSLYDNDSKDNIDYMFGRIFCSPHYENDKFEGKIRIMFYPEGFGYQVLRGIEQDSASKSITSKATRIGKISIWEAYGRIKCPVVNFTFGRVYLGNTNGYYFGNYLDEDAGGYFEGKGIYSHVLDCGINLGKKDNLSVMLGTDDPRLNTGYLRLYNNLNLTDKLGVAVGYRSNLFDTYYNKDAIVSHNFMVSAQYSVMSGMLAYVEAGFRNISSEETHAEVPVMLGVTIPTGKVLDDLDAEVEFYNSNKSASGQAFGYSLFAKKVLVKDHVDLHFGFYSERKLNEPGLGLRLTGKL